MTLFDSEKGITDMKTIQEPTISSNPINITDAEIDKVKKLAPKWAKFAALDPNGYWWYYQAKPTCSPEDGGWKAGSKRSMMSKLDESIMNGVNIKGLWKESLREL